MRENIWHVISSALIVVKKSFEYLTDFNKGVDCYAEILELETKSDNIALTIGKHTKSAINKALKYKPQSTHQFPLARIHDFFDGITNLGILSESSTNAAKVFVEIMQGDKCREYGSDFQILIIFWMA